MGMGGAGVLHTPVAPDMAAPQKKKKIVCAFLHGPMARPRPARVRPLPLPCMPHPRPSPVCMQSLAGPCKGEAPSSAPSPSPGAAPSTAKPT